jgi:hypothetical protein
VVLLIAAIAFAFFFFMQVPLYRCLVASYSPNQWHGRMYGIVFFLSFGFGSFSASFLGYIGDSCGTNWIFTTAAGFALLTLLCNTLLLVRALRISRSSQPYART